MEQAKKKIAFQQITEKKTNIALDKELSMCYSENMTEQKKDTARGREVMKDPTNRRKTLRSLCEAIKFRLVSRARTSIESPPKKRGYEVVAVIPIELFTPNNRKDFRDCLEKEYELANKCQEESRISEHIKDFSAYEYEIYVPKNKNSDIWKDMINKKMGCELNGKIWISNVDTMVAIPHAPESKEEKEDSQEEGGSQNWILKRLWRRVWRKEYSPAENSSEEADIYINTGATIVIITQVKNKGEEDCSQKNLAKFLKRLGDLLNNGINNCSVNKMKEFYQNFEIKKYKENWLVNIIYDEFFYKFYKEIYEEQSNNARKFNHSGRDKFIRLHEKIEINYVFTFFICKGFEFYIIPQIDQYDDNIKYSGDAWFLRQNRIYKRSHNAAEVDMYISKIAYENLKPQEKKDYKEMGKHSWLVGELIPEAEIRPKDLYYIPKINGGGYNDYSSILLRHINRLCCFIKETDKSSDEVDDRNRIIGMQIIINSFWHRMVEFSRVMRTLCLDNYDNRETKKNSEHSRMHKMDSHVESAFVNQIHTTPTLTTQIVDINSTDQDVLTLSDLANYHTTSSAKEYFNEQKEIYFRLRAEKKQMERDDSANRADRKIQVAVLILALITIPIGVIEILTADISPRLKTLAIVLILLFLLGGIGYLVERINNFFSKFSRKLFRKNDKSDNSEAK